MKKKLLSIFYLLFPILIGSIVGIIISDFIDYEVLLKPPLAPPKIFFPIAWTIIYLLLGLSFYLYKKNERETNLLTELIYYSNIFINALWSIFFFVLKWRFFSIIWIIILLISTVFLIKALGKKERLSLYLNIPYLIWTSFATYLTIGIYILN